MLSGNGFVFRGTSAKSPTTHAKQGPRGLHFDPRRTAAHPVNPDNCKYRGNASMPTDLGNHEGACGNDQGISMYCDEI